MTEFVVDLIAFFVSTIFSSKFETRINIFYIDNQFHDDSSFNRGSGSVQFENWSARMFLGEDERLAINEFVVRVAGCDNLKWSLELTSVRMRRRPSWDVAETVPG